MPTELLDTLDLNAPKPFKPRSINQSLTRQLFTNLPDSVKQVGLTLLNQHGYRFYVVDQSRGACYWTKRVITIPSWIWNPQSVERTHHGAPHLKYKCWYICHEMAHALEYINSNGKQYDNRPHGPRFMNELRAICPSDCILYELGYKPRNAQHLLTEILGF